MRISRRNFVRQMTVGAAVSATPWHLDELSQAASHGRASSRRPGELIRLDMNINPYGPSPKVAEAVRENLDLVKWYPDGEYGGLVEQLAEFHRVNSNQVTLGSGSREVLRMAVAAFLARGRNLVLASPTFEPMANLAKRVRAEVIAVPINKHFAHDFRSDAPPHEYLDWLGLYLQSQQPNRKLDTTKRSRSLFGKATPKDSGSHRRSLSRIRRSNFGLRVFH